MVASFNTCSDVKVSYQKTLLQCTNNFKASITVGIGQVLMRVSIARFIGAPVPSAPIAGNEWAVILRRGAWPLETVKLTGLDNNKSVGVENILSAPEDHYDAYIAMVKTSDSSEQPTTQEQLEKAWGDEWTIAIIFEVC